MIVTIITIDLHDTENGRTVPSRRMQTNFEEKSATMLMINKTAFLTVAALLSAAPPVSAQEPNAPQSLNIPASQIKWIDLGGPQLGTVWGDSAKGAHGSFLRLPKGFVSPAHHHTGDYYGVIVEGSVTNAEAEQREVVLGPGSYYVQKGKAEHVTKCVGDTDCLIYISQSKAFDFIPSAK